MGRECQTPGADAGRIYAPRKGEGIVPPPGAMEKSVDAATAVAGDALHAADGFMFAARHAFPEYPVAFFAAALFGILFSVFHGWSSLLFCFYFGCRPFQRTSVDSHENIVLIGGEFSSEAGSHSRHDGDACLDTAVDEH